MELITALFPKAPLEPWISHHSAPRRQTQENGRLQIIRRCDDQKGFQVLPRRWVVERTFGWMTRWRRLVRDYEKRIDVSQAMIMVAMGGNLIRRNAHP